MQCTVVSLYQHILLSVAVHTCHPRVVEAGKSEAQGHQECVNELKMVLLPICFRIN